MGKQMRQMTTEANENDIFEISREELYEAVWSTPVKHLAERYGVSGSYLARVCSSLNVPRPPAGYWQKKAVGKEGPRPELPQAQPGDQLSWRKDKSLSKPIQREMRPTRAKSTRRKSVLSGKHPLLQGVEGLFRRSRKIGEGEFLRPYKLLLPDIISSEDSLARTLDVANDVYNALERNGHRVLFAPSGEAMHRVEVDEQEVPRKDRKYGRYSMGRIWAPHRPTITYIGQAPIGIALTEMTERSALRYMNGKYVREDNKAVKSAKPWQLAGSWTTEQDLPCGRVRLVAYSPYRGVDWKMSWQETTKRGLDGMIPEIIRELESSEQDLLELKAVADEAEARRQREWRERQERWRREEDQREAEKALSDSQKQLAEIMEKWGAATTVERFFQEVEMRLENIPAERRARLEERLALGRAMLGTQDPLDFFEDWVALDERYQSKYFNN